MSITGWFRRAEVSEFEDLTLTKTIPKKAIKKKPGAEVIADGVADNHEAEAEPTGDIDEGDGIVWNDEQEVRADLECANDVEYIIVRSAATHEDNPTSNGEHDQLLEEALGMNATPPADIAPPTDRLTAAQHSHHLDLAQHAWRFGGASAAIEALRLYHGQSRDDFNVRCLSLVQLTIAARTKDNAFECDGYGGVFVCWQSNADCDAISMTGRICHLDSRCRLVYSSHIQHALHEFKNTGAARVVLWNTRLQNIKQSRSFRDAVDPRLVKLRDMVTDVCINSDPAELSARQLLAACHVCGVTDTALALCVLCGLWWHGECAQTIAGRLPPSAPAINSIPAIFKGHTCKCCSQLFRV